MIDWNKLNSKVTSERERINKEYTTSKIIPKATDKTSYLSKILKQVKQNVSNTNKQIKGDNTSNKDRMESFTNFQKDIIQNTNTGKVGFGVMRGALPLNTRNVEKKLYGQDTVNILNQSKLAKAGEIAGIVGQFATPYSMLSPKIGTAVTKIPQISKMGKLGQNVTKSVATDLAVGLPLNVNYAYNKENLSGTDALKSIGANTAIDLVTGGVLETIGGLVLKSGKKVASKADFDNLPPVEKTEVMSELERLAYESNVRKGKITPQNDTLYGNSFRPTMGELPAPNKINPAINPKARPLKDGAFTNKTDFYAKVNDEYDRTIESVADYISNYKPKGVDVGVIPKNGDELMRDGGIRYAMSKNDLWYQDYYKKNGRAPSKAESKKIAENLVDESLRYGNGEFYNDGLDALIKEAEGMEAQGLTGINKKELPRVMQKPFINNRANKETPFTMTRNELPKANKVQPQPLPQAPTKPVQPILPQKGTEIPKEQPFAKNLKDLGADTYKGDMTTQDLIARYGALPKGEQPRAREVELPKETPYGDTQKFAQTLAESQIVDDTTLESIYKAVNEGSFGKFTKTNKTAVDDANTTIAEGLDSALDKFKSVLKADKQATSYDVALGTRTLQELQKAGRYDDALDVAIDLSQILSETGRTLQAARIAKRLSPEGRLMLVSRTAEKISKKTGTKVKLSDKTVKAISEAKTEKEIVEANQKAGLEIWNQIPANWIEKVNAWRYTAMLLNPKTHVRNIVGNALFVPAREFKNLIGSVLEKPFVKVGDRTKAVLTSNDKDLLDFAGKDFANVKSILKNEGKLDDTVRPLEAKIFNTKALEAISKFNLKAMDAEDTWFMKFAYDSSLAQYMKANKITPDKMVGETLEKGRTYAMNESLKATYRDFNSLSNWISKQKKVLSEGESNSMLGSVGKKLGGIALEGAVPFSKTPLNIIKRGIGYSPANLVRGIVNLSQVKKGTVTATEAIDELASGLSGTSIMGLGLLLGYHNIVKGKEGEYGTKDYNYNQMLGSQDYSLNIDGNSYTLDWAAPLSMPFFVGVELAKAAKDNGIEAGQLVNVLDAMTKISDPMVNLSMLKGINDILSKNFDGFSDIAISAGTGYLGQFNPTVFGQAARTIDTTRRDTLSTDKTSLVRQVEKFGRKQVAKNASSTLEPYVDVWGREEKNGSAAENFLSPGYFKKENITIVDRKINELATKLDSEKAKDIIPRMTKSYDVTQDKVKYRMTEKELTRFKKTRGSISYRKLIELFNSQQYENMKDESKVKAITKIYDTAFDAAKAELLNNRIKK